MKKIIPGIIAIVCGLTLNAFTLPSTQVSKNATADPQLVWYEVEPGFFIVPENPINISNPMTKSQFLSTYSFACHGSNAECVRGFYPEELPYDEYQEGVMTIEKNL